ncbi:proline--tRNA ligase, partial [Lacticaseibacillus rhamnosus]
MQTVIVPIFKNDEEKSAVMNAVSAVQAELKAAGIRVKGDQREGLTPGFKFNDWEMRGGPTRVGIGPKDGQN